MTWRSGGILHSTSPLRLHDRPDGAESAVLSSNIPIITVALTYVYSRILYSQKQSPKHFFSALSESPRGWSPTFSNLSPNDTQLRIFSRLSTAILTNDFTQALPTSNVTHTSTPRSDSPRRLTYPRFFPASLPPF